MFKIYKKQGADLYDFTDLCSPITLRSSSGEISEELGFETLGTSIKEFDIIVLYEDNKKIYEGVAVTVEKSEYTKRYTCFDFGWYLNKNEDAYQFKDTCSKCIEKILNDYSIPIGGIVDIPIVFKKISRGSLSDIISKIIEYATLNTGVKYVWQMRENKFYLEKLSDKVVVYNTSLFGQSVDITKLMSNPTLSTSVENLKNAVKVVDQEENSINILATAENSALIKTQGKLQQLVYLQKSEKSTAKNVAQSQLSLLSKPETKLSTELIGIIACRANTILEFDGSVMDVKGKFKILNCEHKISKTSHTMSLELELI